MRGSQLLMFVLTGTVCDTGLIHACSKQHLLSSDLQLGVIMQLADAARAGTGCAQLKPAPCLSVSASRTSPLVGCTTHCRLAVVKEMRSKEEDWSSFIAGINGHT
jgi:hypothetical protein